MSKYTEKYSINTQRKAIFHVDYKTNVYGIESFGRKTFYNLKDAKEFNNWYPAGNSKIIYEYIGED